MTDIEPNPGYREFTFRKIETTPEYDDYRRRWRENPQTGKVEDMPLNLDVELSNRCNLRCPFCVREFMNEGQGNMEWADYVLIMSQIYGNVPAVKLNWRGEPTLHPLLPQMVKLAKDHRVLEVMLNTNGTLLTKELSGRLIDAGLDKIIFSIESIRKERYPKYRPGGNLDEVLFNISDLLKAREVRGSAKPIVRVQKIDFPELRDELYMEFFRELGAEQVAINTYKEKDVTKVCATPRPCAQPFQRLFITWKGEFRACCQGQLHPVIGSIHRMSIYSAWHSSLMDKLRVLNLKNEAYLSLCSKCDTARGV